MIVRPLVPLMVRPKADAGEMKLESRARAARRGVGDTQNIVLAVRVQ